MAAVVQILSADNGELYRKRPWHLIWDLGGCHGAFCTGEAFGYGVSGCRYKTKEGKITCLQCVEKIKEIKAIKL